MASYYAIVMTKMYLITSSVMQRRRTLIEFLNQETVVCTKKLISFKPLFNQRALLELIFLDK